MSSRALERRSHHRLDECGASLTELIMGIGLMTLVIAPLSYWMYYSIKVQQHSMALIAIEDVRGRILTALTKGTAFKTQTMTKNSSLSCVVQGTKCPREDNLIGVYDRAGEVVFDSSNPTSGFTKGGVLCSTFAADTATDCTWRYRISWRPLCPDDSAGGCVHPQIYVFGVLERSENPSAEDLPINLKRYDIELLRASESVSVKSTCSMFGGSYNEAMQTCTLTSDSTEIDCPVGAAVMGFNAQGEPGCQPVSSAPAGSATCGTAEVMVGFTPTGALDCRHIASLVTGTCGPDRAVVGLNANGTVKCGLITHPASGSTCPSGQLLRGLTSTGAIICGAIP